MDTATLPWLDGVVQAIASIGIVLFVIVNGVFLLNVVIRRDRSFVNRWTRPLVVTDAALLVAAVGTPVIAMALKLAARGLSGLATMATSLGPSK